MLTVSTYFMSRHEIHEISCSVMKFATKSGHLSTHEICDDMKTASKQNPMHWTNIDFNKFHEFMKFHEIS